MKLKRCSQCGKEKEYTSEYFHYSDRKTGKLRSNCKECRNAKQRKTYGETQHVYTCTQCGDEYNAKAINRDSYCSRECYFQHKKEESAKLNLVNTLKRIKVQNCKTCNKEFKSLTIQNCCSHSCKEIYAKEQNRQRTKQYYYEQIEERKRNFKPEKKTCKECGEGFLTEFGRRRANYCSDECANRFKNRKRETDRRNKLKENGKVDYTITLDKLIKRDKCVCHICNKKVNRSNNSNANDYPSIDHVIPVAKGGTHTWDNVKLAHRGCNSVKSDKVVYEEGNGQVAFSI